MRRIYLDHAATSPLLPAAREAMLPWLDAGNASSLYAEGRAAKSAVDDARAILSDKMGCLFAELLFTSGGTEGANLALVGTALAHRGSARNRILIGAAEHHCVLHTQPLLTALGYRVETIPVDREARIDLDALESQLGDDVLMVSAMHANNELGTFNDIPAIVELAHRHGSVVHSDAVQTLGWSIAERTHLSALGADLITVSAHKIGGPKGIGAIYVRAGTKLKPLIAGGGQEREVRGGTENVAAICGFAAAAPHTASPDTRAVRDCFLQSLSEAGFQRSVRPCAHVLPGHAHVRLPGVDAETMLIRLDRAGVSASSGSACSSGSVERSHVLTACGYSPDEAKQGLRFTFGPATTAAEAQEAATRIHKAATSILQAR